MSRFAAAATLVAAAGVFLAAGCGQIRPRPTKQIMVPGGAPPVLTSDELLENRYQVSAQAPRTVAPATFVQPGEPPRMLRPLAEWTEQEAAADALGRIGAPAVPALVQTLDSPDAAVRLKAVDVLSHMGPDAHEAVPRLVKLLGDPDPTVRKAAARALGQIGPLAHDAVPALMHRLVEPPPVP
jgi:HEAT repeat protein